MNTPTIAIIGAGNMGQSLIGGLIKDGHPKDKLLATDTSLEKLEIIKKKFHVRTTTNNIEAVQAADVVIFAIKPQHIAKVVSQLAKTMHSRKPLLISIAAGIRVQNISHWLAGKFAIIRAMPNTPALISCGATALYANENVTNEERNIAESILRAVGVVVWVDNEEKMDTVTALSGSGPAYFFIMMEALEEAAIQLGLSPDTAHLLTLQTALGAARMAIESDTPLAELRRQVTSPGGTTEKAIAILEENHLRRLFLQTLQAAKHRSEELASLLGDK